MSVFFLRILNSLANFLNNFFVGVNNLGKSTQTVKDGLYLRILWVTESQFDIKILKFKIT